MSYRFSEIRLRGYSLTLVSVALTVCTNSCAWPLPLKSTYAIANPWHTHQNQSQVKVDKGPSASDSCEQRTQKFCLGIYGKPPNLHIMSSQFSSPATTPSRNLHHIYCLRNKCNDCMLVRAITVLCLKGSPSSLRKAARDVDACTVVDVCAVQVRTGCRHEDAAARDQ